MHDLLKACALYFASSMISSLVVKADQFIDFFFKIFHMQHGGNLTIPADRFLHEVAFKLWKAPKYGA